jgi:hypothetical protein
VKFSCIAKILATLSRVAWECGGTVCEPVEDESSRIEIVKNKRSVGNPGEEICLDMVRDEGNPESKDSEVWSRRSRCKEDLETAND